MRGVKAYGYRINGVLAAYACDDLDTVIAASAQDAKGLSSSPIRIDVIAVILIPDPDPTGEMEEPANLYEEDDKD